MYEYDIREFDVQGYTPQKTLMKRGIELFADGDGHVLVKSRFQVKIYGVCRAPWAHPNHPLVFVFVFLERIAGERE